MDGAGAGAAAAGFVIFGTVTVAAELMDGAGAGAAAGFVIFGTDTVAVETGAGAGAGAADGLGASRACSRGMDTVLVIVESLKSDAGIGFSGSGRVILPMGAVLVDMNFGGSSTVAAGFRFSRMDGGATDLIGDGVTL